MIKHAATNLKTAFTFEPEEPEDALTNASVYALKIFDPNPYSDRILTSTSRQIKKSRVSYSDSDFFHLNSSPNRQIAKSPDQKESTRSFRIDGQMQCDDFFIVFMFTIKFFHEHFQNLLPDLFF